MASALSVVNNIDENFCQCSICLEQFKEPKLLPCLHRYCCECLRQLMQDAQGVLKCPDCREECEIPAEGVNGFKTDSYMNCIVDFIQLQKSLQDDQMRECFNCCKHVKVSAYCFKCGDFFCEECHKHHVTSKMMKDHRSHILSLEDIESKNISFKTLVSLKDAPRCQTHSENISQLCCTTCGNLPICVACSFGKHKDHAISDVNSLASIERDKLTEKLGSLQEWKQKTLDKMAAKVKNFEEEIIYNSNEVTGKFQSQYEHKRKDVEAKRNKLREESKINITEIEENNRKKNSVLQENLEREIKEIKDKYDKLFETEREKKETCLDELQKKLENEEFKLDAKRNFLERKSSYIIKLIETRKSNKLEKSKQIVQHFANTTKRYDNLTSTGANIISAKNDWTAVNCIPDIFSAMDPLIQDMNRDFPELDNITACDISSSSFVNLDVADSVSITEHEESVIEFEGFDSGDYCIYSLISTDNGNIVISGDRNEESTFVSLLNTYGKSMLQKIFQPIFRSWLSPCAVLSKFKLVTASSTTEVGLLDMCDGSYFKKDMKDIVPNWEEDQGVYCISTDTSKNHIYICTSNGVIGHVYVLDDQLQFCRTLNLPHVIERLSKIELFVDQILACDRINNQMYVLNMEGGIIYEFKPPIGSDWKPLNVLADKNGFIYILMQKIFPEIDSSSGEEDKKGNDREDNEGDGTESRDEDDDRDSHGDENKDNDQGDMIINDRKENEGDSSESSDADDDRHSHGDENEDNDEVNMIVVQYSQDWKRILATKPVHSLIHHMTIMESSKEEKLLLSTPLGKIYVYGLVSQVCL